ncbi:hypothetical protein SAMN05444358_101564 [Ruegeria halocynthiae]|uniref:Antibiotic biosynthesis monooxygenase n=1 Tax=Ruegeria halocynthiae TaxID=985054 RepID=A0A1H2SS20_9RHOB|nr:hypothetical protein [Ruegeria halocynthiae]SDW34412.1 hypothetical protein SAMN05444358_101564 [Ruegeria halocynthiae]
MTHVAEIVTFTLADGTMPEQFVKLSQASEAFVRAAPGFAHRQLSQGEDGRWTDYVVWTDMKSAKDAAAAFMHQDFAPALIAAINPDSAQMRHETVQWNMTA